MNRRHLLMALFAAAIILGIGFSRLHRDEPRYEGRRLSSWLNDFPAPRLSCSTQGNATLIALVSMGTNAVPRLIDELCQRDSTIGIKVRLFLTRNRLHNCFPTAAQTKSTRAVDALDFLAGYNLLPAEELLSAFEKRDLDNGSAMWLGHLLISIDPANIRPLLKLAHSVHPGKRVAALDALSSVGGMVPEEFELPVMMVLTNAISDPDKKVSTAAEAALVNWTEVRQQ
jgi:hypothetical protein